MGYKRKTKMYKLNFNGTEYEGLEITVSGLSTGEFIDYIKATAELEGGTDGTEEMMKMLAKHIVSWNLVGEDDRVLPVSIESLRANELDLNILISTKWTEAISQVPESLGKESTAGSDGLLASIPTASL